MRLSPITRSSIRWYSRSAALSAAERAEPRVTRIKLTGLRSAGDATAAIDAGVDIVTCVFFSKSPRYVKPDVAARIRHSVGRSAELHGIFVDTPVALVQRVVDQCGLDAAQLFGSEPREDIELLEPHAYKAVSIREELELASLVKTYGQRQRHRQTHAAPNLLVHLAGPMSREFSAVSDAARRLQVALSSEVLAPDTVEGAIRDAAPWCVDVWRGIERSPGEIDWAKLDQFVKAVRRADTYGNPGGQADGAR